MHGTNAVRAPLRGSRVVQLLQDAAVCSVLILLTPRAQRHQLNLKRLQRCNTSPYVGNVVIQERIDLAACLAWRVSEVEEASHFIERHVEQPAMAYETETLLVLQTVDTIVARASARR